MIFSITLKQDCGALQVNKCEKTFSLCVLNIVSQFFIKRAQLSRWINAGRETHLLLARLRSQRWNALMRWQKRGGKVSLCKCLHKTREDFLSRRVVINPRRKRCARKRKKKERKGCFYSFYAQFPRGVLAIRQNFSTENGGQGGSPLFYFRSIHSSKKRAARWGGRAAKIV